MMRTQLDMIEADFKVLQSEFKKKNPQIRESVEMAMTWLQQIKQQQSNSQESKFADQQTALIQFLYTEIASQPVELLEPLRLMFEQKITKTYPMAMNLLQKITQIFVVVEHQTLLLILGALKEASSDVLDEMTEIRILQMLLTFLDPHTIQLSKEFVTLVMQCCFQMMATKSFAVKSTIQATLKQLFTIILEQFVDGCKQAIPLQKQRDIFKIKKQGVQFTPEEVTEISDLLRTQFQGGDSIYIIVREIVQNLAFTVLMFEQRSAGTSKRSSASQYSSEQSLNFKSSAYSCCVVLDLINLCLTMTNEVFRFFPEINSIFELQIAPTIEPLLHQKTPQSSLGMRLMKCATLIINNLGCSLNLLRTILTDADSFTSRSRDGTTSFNLNWRCLIAFECLQIVISNPGLTELFATSSLAIGAPVLIQILECYIQASRAIEQSNDPAVNQMVISSSRQSQRGLYQSTQKIPKVINSQNLDGEISPPTFSQIQRIIIESICTFADNFVFVFTAIGIKLGTPSENRGRNRETEESQSMVKCKRMLTLCWKPLLETLQKLIRTTSDESNIHMLLKAFQSCIGACGSANCYEARDAFLQALCNECLTVQSSGYSSSAGKSGSAAQREPETARKSVANVNIKPSAVSEDLMTINERNVLICKTFFNIAHCLCHVLDVKSWFLIFETMQKIESVIHKKLQVHGLVQKKDRPAFNLDGNQLIINFEDLKKKADEKMLQFNIIERSQNKTKPGHHSRLSISGSSQTVTAASRPSFSMLIPGNKNLIIEDSVHGTNSVEEIRGLPLISNASSAATSDPLLADLHILLEAFDSLFTSTLLFDMQSLSELICALAQLTVGVLENIHTPTFSTQSRTSTESEILAQINTFAMSRLVETALVNVSRIDNFWKIIVAHFDILSNCQVLAIRLLTIEALQTIILAIFAHKKTLTVQAQGQSRVNSSKVAKDRKGSSEIFQINTGQPMPSKVTTELENIDSEADSNILEESKGDTISDVASEVSSQNEGVQSTEEYKSGKYRSGRSGRGGDESWENSTWQYTILSPLSDQLKSSHNSDKNAVIKGFEKIIQACGQQIKNEGWRIIIVTISKSLEHESDSVVAGGFRCLKLVVSNFINRLSQSNFVTILNAIHMYASNSGSNINNNLIAIGMFQNVADYAAKQINQTGAASATFNSESLSVVQQKVAAINFEKIWGILFERIQSLGSNKRAEVRKTTIHTLENIVMTHGGSFQLNTVWPKVLNDTVLVMLKNCVDRYAQSTSSIVNSRDSNINYAKATIPGDQIVAATPTFFGSGGGISQTQGKAQPKMQFDDATVTKALRQNDSQWEETCTVLVQTACRSLKKFFSVIREKMVVEGELWTMANDFWGELTDCMNLMLSVGSSEVCVLLFKALNNFLGDIDCLKLFLWCEEESRTFLTAVVDYLVVEYDNLQSQKTDKNKTIKLLKICPMVIETLQKLYNKQTLEVLEDHLKGIVRGSDKELLLVLVEKQTVSVILNMLEMILNTSKAAENLQSFGTNKLLTEERAVFDFVESLNDFYYLKTDTQQLFNEFLLRFTEYKCELRQEAFIKRSFSIFYSALLRGRVQKAVLKDIVPKMLDRMKELIDLRYDNQACVTLVFQAKGQQTLPLTIGLYLIHITSFLVNPEQFKARLLVHSAQISENRLGVHVAAVTEEAKKVTGPGGHETGGTGNQRQVQLPDQTKTLASATVIQQQSMILAPGSANERDLLFSDQLEFQPCPSSEIRPEEYRDYDTKQLVWERVIELLQSTLLFESSRVADHNKAVLQEVVKASQELDMQVMNFILNCLLPNSAMTQGQQNSETQKVLEQSLVNIIDRGCTNSTGFSQQGSFTSGGTSQNLSRYCFTNMFELCRYQPPAQSETSSDQQDQADAHASIKEIKLKIARIATPILINRCKQTLKKFIKDEKKVGSVGMSKSRISEVVFILDKLRDLDCYPQIRNSIAQPQRPSNSRTSQDPFAGVGNFKKGHLIELMPVLSDLILRNDQVIKESLRHLFLEISMALNQNMLAAAQAASQQQEFAQAAGGTEFVNRVSTGAAEEGNRGSSGGEGE